MNAVFSSISDSVLVYLYVTTKKDDKQNFIFKDCYRQISLPQGCIENDGEGVIHSFRKCTLIIVFFFTVSPLLEQMKKMSKRSAVPKGVQNYPSRKIVHHAEKSVVIPKAIGWK